MRAGATDGDGDGDNDKGLEADGVIQSIGSRFQVPGQCICEIVALPCLGGPEGSAIRLGKLTIRNKMTSWRRA